ncbi:LytR family transcriptional regulator [Mycobacterium intermedium]|uniref:LytR family transcriptional regulator n=2 Tax=Mycobacterium intermedium TaxID=28445 RepID=A0A1E3S658_MYCIE|nr:LCP family protein [Mycobacterium intermedium]ODQ97646.1 LytR family transcriptional regulator [Mycobacterium intermedium]OPE51496.1 LytR family transcriptional regulator [Mycobacterium intermedium]ORA96834.1 LytR family transcriptional regulator [Mycobacterium intermedium]
MSDGDSGATRQPRHASDPGSAVERSTPLQHRMSGAAPWERFSIPSDDEVTRSGAGSFAEPEHGEKPEQEKKGGSHLNGGVSVAELIAKLGAPADRPRRRRHLAPDPEPEPEPEPQPDSEHAPVDSTPEHAAEADEFDDSADTQVIPTPAYALQLLEELPDLGSAHDPSETDKSEPSSASPEKPKKQKAPKAHKKSARAPKTREPKTKTRRRILVAGRALAAMFAVLALVLTGGAWHWSTSKNDRMNTVSALDPQSNDIVDPVGQYGDENFLIVGMDSRLGANSTIGAGDTEDAGGARSDTVMLVNIPANRQRVVAVSFPRDLAINPIQCEAWNPETGKYGPIYDEKTGTMGPKMVYTETKLNSAFSFGGPKCLVKVIQKLSGLAINRFIAVDFVGFARMVEAIGGVEVCTTTPLRDYELGTVLERAGRQRIDGQTALNYVRARQVTTESNGDYGRIKRQQRFLSSLLRSMISEDTLLNLNKLNNAVNIFIGNSYVDNVKTRDLVELGRSLQHMAAGHVTFVTVPTGVTDQDGNEPPRTADMKALFTAIINDEPLPKENDHNAQTLGSSPTTSPSTTKKVPPANPANEPQHEQLTTTSPSEVTVQVSNGTSTQGLATTAANQLKKNGFNVMTPDDYPSPLKATTVFFSPGNEQAAATVAAAFGNSKIERVTGIGQVVQVVLGPDFSSVVSPPPTGTSVSVQVTRGSATTPTKLPEDLTVTNAADTTCE